MYNLRKRNIVIVGIAICALIMMMFLIILGQKKSVSGQPTETEETVLHEEGTESTEEMIEAVLETEIETEIESEYESEVTADSETEVETEAVVTEEENSEEEIDEPEGSWVADLNVAQNTTQMIVVAAEGTYATVSMHTKDETGIWSENFSVKGRVGRNGIGKVAEGDGKTPVGEFRFYTAFGILSNPGLSALPYLQVDETHHWVDDSNSKYYNQLVSTRDVEIDWISSEYLYTCAPSYNYALALNYNETCIPGLGSAIFLHCPNNTFGTTAGCIAIPEANMIQVMQLLQKDCIIIIDSTTNVSNY